MAFGMYTIGEQMPHFLERLTAKVTISREAASDDYLSSLPCEEPPACEGGF